MPADSVADPHSTPQFTAGTPVVHIDDPTKIGVTTGRTQKRGPFLFIEVKFGTQRSSIRAEYLKPHGVGELTIEEKLFSEKFAGIEDLRRQEKHNSPRSLEEIARAIGNWKREGINFDFCFIYPEVSANVQSFLRSPARRRGTFLFVDVGAGTVDASTFIWPAPDHEHRLSYLGADVIPLGSSQIELRCTASVATRLTRELCLCKEHKPCTKELKIDLQAELEVTGEELAIEVTSELRRILNLTRQKLSRSEWNEIRVLLAGGGSANAFYTKAVEAAFQLWHMEPASLQLPTPAADVDWPVTGATARDVLFRRISVAYGLSFDRGELDGHRFPDEIAPWRAEVVKTEAVIAPDKDVC
jgi:hypothetical protein